VLLCAPTLNRCSFSPHPLPSPLCLPSQEWKRDVMGFPTSRIFFSPFLLNQIRFCSFSFFPLRREPPISVGSHRRHTMEIPLCMPTAFPPLPLCEEGGFRIIPSPNCLSPLQSLTVRGGVSFFRCLQFRPARVSFTPPLLKLSPSGPSVERGFGIVLPIHCCQAPTGGPLSLRKTLIGRAPV